MARDGKADLVFRALGDPTRRRLLELVATQEKSVKDLTAEFGISQSAVSQHLRLLRQAGLAKERQVGRNRLYRMHDAPLRHVESWLKENTDFWATRLEGLGTYLRKKHGKKNPL